ncbi:MAG TPA: hypothetical protein VF041_22800 [Gemmatimonadaceae bacterium]
MTRTLWFAAAALCAFASAAPAQSLASRDGRLSGRLDSATVVRVEAIADTTRAAGLPTEPLIDKALEGASKHASPERIVDAVRGLARRLAVARTALGADASDADLLAGAGALYEGVSSDDLTRLRRARRAQPVALPLVVLADLIERGVPAGTATRIVLDVARSGAGDDTFASMRRDVELDIRAGAPPAIAASTRARGAIYSRPSLPGAAAAGGPTSTGEALGPTKHP